MMSTMNVRNNTRRLCLFARKGWPLLLILFLLLQHGVFLIFALYDKGLSYNQQWKAARQNNLGFQTSSPLAGRHNYDKLLVNSSLTTDEVDLPDVTVNKTSSTNAATHIVDDHSVDKLVNSSSTTGGIDFLEVSPNKTRSTNDTTQHVDVLPIDRLVNSSLSPSEVDSVELIVSGTRSGNATKYVDVLPINPRTSRRPQQIDLFETDDPAIRIRHGCIAKIRKRQADLFAPWLQPDSNSTDRNNTETAGYLLVDPAYHSNVGDHMLTTAELMLMERMNYTTFDECGYFQFNNFATHCNKYYEMNPITNNSLHPTAIWQAGGNWGDLYNREHRIRIRSFEPLLRNYHRVIGFPQSLYYKDSRKQQKQAEWFEQVVLAGLNASGTTMSTTREETMNVARSRVVLSWREHISYETAKEIYPFVTNLLVPDMAFQLGPFAPLKPQSSEGVDLLLFMRKDKESSLAPERTEDSVRKMLSSIDGGSELTFRIVDWGDRLSIFDSKDFLFTQTAIQLISMGRVLVCDRLHGTLLAYLTGIPFVYIDNSTGKVTKALKVALETSEECADGQKSKWARGVSLDDALQKAVGFLDKPEFDGRT